MLGKTLQYLPLQEGSRRDRKYASRTEVNARRA